MPSFVVTLAGFEIWQGVVLKSIPEGVIVIQDETVNNVSQYFFCDTAGWIIAAIVSVAYLGLTLNGVIQGRRHGVAVRDHGAARGQADRRARCGLPDGRDLQQRSRRALPAAADRRRSC